MVGFQFFGVVCLLVLRENSISECDAHSSVRSGGSKSILFVPFRKVMEDVRAVKERHTSAQPHKSKEPYNTGRE